LSIKIRLKRLGTKKRPYYRIVVMDTRAPRDGRSLEEIGFYHPIEVEEKQLLIKDDRVKEWLEKGAKPSNTVKRLLKRKNIQ
jgi:small subunit ribosomal protein S16